MFWVRSAYDAVERMVDMRATSHDGATRTPQGHSIGRWEDGALVVDTTHFSDSAVGNGGGQKRFTNEPFTDALSMADTESQSSLRRGTDIRDMIYMPGR